MLDFQNDIDQCLPVLEQGGIILYPTDTVWGIGCDATNANAVEKIYRLKQRPDEKAMIVLVASEKEVLKYASTPDLRVFEHLLDVEKPTTVIYEGAIGLASNLPADDGTIAIRICNDTFCKHLIKRFRNPIVATSANISGQPVARTFSEIRDEIKEGVDYIVKYRQEDETIAEPSRVIRWNKDGTMVIVRN
jgi:L-threonylcarbamoyladenylate synthase